MIKLIIDRYKYIIILIIIIVLPFGYLFSKQEHFYHISMYFEKDDPEFINYQKFQQEYGNDEAVAILFKQDEIFTKDGIELIGKISKEVRKIKNVRGVYSLTELEETLVENDTIITRKILPENNLTNAELRNAKERALKNKWVRDFLISRDSKTTALIFELDPLEDIKKREVVNEIRRLTQKIAGGKIKLHYTGIPFIEVEVNEISKKDMRRFVPVAALLIFIIIIIMLRNINLSILCQINLLFIFICGIGLFVACGEKFNLVTNILSPILLSIAIANSIHFLSYYREHLLINGHNHTKAVRQTICCVWLPCFLSSITTAVGFLSFNTSGIVPVKVLGIYTSIGVMIAFIFTVIFLPSGIMLLQSKRSKKNTNQNASKSTRNRKCLLSRVLPEVSSFTMNNYRSIGFIMIVIAIVSISGITKLRFESNSKNYLSETNSIRKDMEFAEDNIGGLTPFILLIEAESDKYDFRHSKSLKLLDEVQNGILNDIRKFTTSFSISDYIKEINQVFNSDDEKYNIIPEDEKDILDYYEIGDSEVINRIVSSDYKEARISFQSSLCSTVEAKRIRSRISNYLDRTLGDKYSHIMTGMSSLHFSLENNLVATQIKSLLFAIIIIFFLIFFICRTLSLTIIAMVVNVFPIFIILGFMGCYGIPLDVTTVMIGSVTIGIAVDDTIHFLIWFRRNIKAGRSYRDSVFKTFLNVGKPIVITSLVLFSGFSVLVLGNLKPTQTFGLLTAFAMLCALIGDLIFLPALLLIFKPKITEKNQVYSHLKEFLHALFSKTEQVPAVCKISKTAVNPRLSGWQYNTLPWI